MTPPPPMSPAAEGWLRLKHDLLLRQMVLEAATDRARREAVALQREVLIGLAELEGERARAAGTVAIA